MNASKFVNALLEAGEVTAMALPTVVTSGVTFVTTTFHVGNEGMAYLADEVDMIRLRQVAENAPIRTALQSIEKLAKAKDAVDTSAMTEDEQIAHVESCFALQDKLKPLFAKLDKD
jgi:hypothetical protein